MASFKEAAAYWEREAESLRAALREAEARASRLEADAYEDEQRAEAAEAWALAANHRRCRAEEGREVIADQRNHALRGAVAVGKLYRDAFGRAEAAEAQREDWKERAALEARRLLASGGRAEAAERKVDEYRQALQEIDRADKQGDLAAIAVRALGDAFRVEQPRQGHICGGPPYGYASWCRACEPNTQQSEPGVVGEPEREGAERG